MIEAIRSVLDSPLGYRAWSRLLGIRRYSQVLVTEHIRPESTDRILEIGCGPGTMVPFLPTPDYVGFDASPEYIKLAQKRFPDRRFVCERVSQYTLAERSYFDIVLAFGILHHLDDAEATRLFRIAHDALQPGGRLVTHDGVWTSNQSGVAKYLLARDRGQFVRTEEQYVTLASQVFSTVRHTIRHDLLWIPYTHILFECVR
jgi:cyclopropane fatty-acyl-phospholipid synthase-like methyltransferase